MKGFTSILSFPSVVVGNQLFSLLSFWGPHTSGNPESRNKIRSFSSKQTGSQVHAWDDNYKDRSRIKTFRDDGLTTNGCTSNTFRTVSAGFTLIELLVVVLIIGILAVVAVPQYQLAVDKSKFASNMPLLDAVEKAQEAYYLANGQYADTFDQLDVEIPKTYAYKKPESWGGDCWATGDPWGYPYICTNQCYSFISPWQPYDVHYFRTHNHSSSYNRVCVDAKRACLIGNETVNSNPARWRRLCNSLGTETSQRYAGGSVVNSSTWDLR